MIHYVLIELNRYFGSQSPKFGQKMTQIDITFSKFNLFLILNHHMVAYGARNHVHIYIIILEG